jgi:hypothetical protein
MKNNYSQANLPSKEDRAIPNAWTAHNGYLKSQVKTSTQTPNLFIFLLHYKSFELTIAYTSELHANIVFYKDKKNR